MSDDVHQTSAGPAHLAADDTARGSGLKFAAWHAAWWMALVVPFFVWQRWGPATSPDSPDPGLATWFAAFVAYYTAYWLLSAGLLVRAGWLTLRSGRYPYPGQWAPFQTPSRNTWWVRFNALGFFVMAALLLYGLGLVWFEMGLAAVLGLVDVAPAVPCP